MTDARTTRIGFIGLGKMGVPMCRHIARAGYKVSAFVRSDAGRATALDIKATPMDSLVDLANASDIIVSAISDDRALRDVAGAPGQLAAAMRAGQILIETSTVSPAASAYVANLLEPQGVAYLRSPVSGSTATAEAAALTVLASGPKDAFDAVQPVYACFSKKQYHVGDGEEARYLKLTLNAMVGSMSALVGEAMTLGLKGGIDAATMLDVINNSAVASPLIGYKTKMLTEGDYSPAFSVTGMMKDFDIILSVGRAEHVPLPLISQIRQQYEAAFNNGRADEDFFVLCDEYKRHAGL